MIGAVIYYGKNTLVAELPMGTIPSLGWSRFSRETK